MDAKMKRNIGLLMGIIVIILDLYWTYLAYKASYGISTTVDLGIVIFIASLIWFWTDL